MLRPLPSRNSAGATTCGRSVRRALDPDADPTRKQERGTNRRVPKAHAAQLELLAPIIDSIRGQRPFAPARQIWEILVDDHEANPPYRVVREFVLTRRSTPSTAVRRGGPRRPRGQPTAEAFPFLPDDSQSEPAKRRSSSSNGNEPFPELPRPSAQQLAEDWMRTLAIVVSSESGTPPEQIMELVAQANQPASVRVGQHPGPLAPDQHRWHRSASLFAEDSDGDVIGA